MGFPAVTPLIFKIRIGSFSGEKNRFPELPETSPIHSETGQISWDYSGKKGMITINTPRTQALIGFTSKFLNAGTSNLKARFENPFCAVVLTSLDGKNLDRSGTMLLSATAASGLTGIVRTEDGKSLKEWGIPPFLIAPAEGAITLSGLKGATNLEIMPLDGAGIKMNGNIKAGKINGTMTFETGNTGTVWYLISVKR